MDEQAFEETRRALHGIAELVLAGPQYERSGDIRLRATAGGFGTVVGPEFRVDGLDLVTPSARLSLTGSFGSLADAAGLVARDLRDVYREGPDVRPDERLEVDAAAAARIAQAFSEGDAALRALVPGEEPVLWPEHFDIGITVDEVNYGVSPGDGHIATPYAYVGPWQPREGEFWNMPFGATRLLADLGDASSILAFFREGRARASERP